MRALKSLRPWIMWAAALAVVSWYWATDPDGGAETLSRVQHLVWIVVVAGPVYLLRRALSFEWRYKLTLLFTDFVDSPDTIVIPLLVWLATNQPDLIADAERRYKTLSFEAEPVDHDAIDIVFNLELTERVIVKPVPGGFTCEHVDEPPLPDLGGDMGWQVYLKGELIIEGNASA